MGVGCVCVGFGGGVLIREKVDRTKRESRCQMKGGRGLSSCDIKERRETINSCSLLR